MKAVYIKEPGKLEVIDVEKPSIKKDTQVSLNSTDWVGVYPGMTDEKIDYMAKVIKEGLLQ